MKKLKLIMLTITAMLFLGIGSVSAQEKEPLTVIIRVTEESRGRPAIITTDMEGKVTNIALEKGWKDESGNNAALIQKEINKWKEKGYKITHLSSTYFGDASTVALRTTIILEK
jgi:hypothetical protein